MRDVFVKRSRGDEEFHMGRGGKKMLNTFCNWSLIFLLLQNGACDHLSGFK